MAIEVIRLYENSVNLGIKKEGRPLLEAQITEARDGEPSSLLVVWETVHGIHSILNEAGGAHRDLAIRFEMPRQLAKPPRYSYLGVEDSPFIAGYAEVDAPWSDDGIIVYDLEETLSRKAGTLVADHLYNRKKSVGWVQVTTPFFSIYVDGENQPNRRVAIRALESISGTVVSILSRTCKESTSLDEQTQIAENLEIAWRELPKLTPINNA